MNEITPIIIKVDRMMVETQSFLINEEIALEYIWRNNNYHSAIEVSEVSEVTIHGLDDDDEVLWIALDKDQGSDTNSLDDLRLHKPPSEKGNYCLIVTMTVIWYYSITSIMTCTIPYLYELFEARDINL